MRRAFSALGVGAACWLAAALPAGAVIPTIDEVPAATLLLPYFEVDLDDRDGVTTLFSVNNASATAVLAHVVVWSDLSFPVLDFNIYLTGYDVQSINLRDLVVNGRVPRTASAGQDPADSISPKGDFSQDINFASCTDQLPLPQMPAALLEHLQLSLTGKPSPLLGNFCAGRDLGDRIARGYVTVDTVNNCTLHFPGDPAYFLAGGQGDATDQNVLWGDFVFVNPAKGIAFGETLVHIEASATNPETSQAGQYTFYGRYVGWTAADNREPLATHFAARFLLGDAFETDYLVWRDSKTNQGVFTCPATNGRPTWFPLAQEGLVVFDEQENPELVQTFPFSPQPPQSGITPFGAEAQRTLIGGVDFPVPFDFGWILLDLNTVIAANANPPEDPAAAQAWVIDPMRGKGPRRIGAASPQEDSPVFEVGFNATALDSAAAADHSRPDG